MNPLIKQLADKILKAKQDYYNDQPKMSDAAYDKLEDQLRKLDPKHPILKLVGAPVAAKTKVRLPFGMASLDKAKPDNGVITPWLKKVEGPWIASDKLDGTALEITYTENGVKAYTRGNGIIGQDVSFLVPHLKIPAKCPYEAIRCEAVMPDATFKAIWAAEFKNARNLANGLFNRLTRHNAHKDIKLVVHEVLSPRGVPSKQLAKLKAAGFDVVWNEVYETLSESKLVKLLAARKVASKYTIDGLVIEQDKAHTLRAGNPTYKIAFKNNLEEDTALARVVRVDWQVSKHGYLKPVLIIEAIE